MAKVKRNYITKAVSEILPRVVTPIIKKNKIKSLGLIYDWKKIVGPKLAQLTRFERISYKYNEPMTATLYLTVHPSLALEIQHTQPQLIAKINTHLGYKAVDRIQIKQGHFDLNTSPKTPQLSEKDRTKIESTIKSVENQELNQVLTNLGEKIYTHS